MSEFGSLTEWTLILPEIFLILTLIFVVVAEITYHGEKRRLVLPTALMGLGSAMVQSLIMYQFKSVQIFNHALSIDGLAIFFRLLFITLGGLAILMCTHSKELAPDRRSEYTVLILSSTIGMCLAAFSADILLSFLALQFVNVACFFLAGYGRRSASSNEAGVKHLLFSTVSGALLAYGLGILFSVTHTLNIHEIRETLLKTPLSPQVGLVVFMLIFLSLSFQIGAFPMYLWVPDVLEGSPTIASSFLSLGSRALGFVVAFRLIIGVFAQPALASGQWQVLGTLNWTGIVAFLSGVTMIFGSVLAFGQKAAKRMTACLIVATSGHLLLGFLVLDEVGIAALLFNLVIELFAITGVFYVLAFLMEEFHSDKFHDLKGTLRKAAPESIYLILFLLCLIGLPPTPGFFGKFTLIGAALHHHWTGLAIIAMVSMALSAVVVARFAFSLIGDFKNPIYTPVFPNTSRKIFLFFLTVPIVLAGVFSESVLQWAVQSVDFILW